jgi:hypothetical protein
MIHPRRSARRDSIREDIRWDEWYVEKGLGMHFEDYMGCDFCWRRRRRRRPVKCNAA